MLGKEHPDTATTYNNIAFVYYNQGEYAKALEWLEKALDIVEKAFGKEHPDTATTYNNTAFVYYNQGEYAKALEWNEKALAIFEKVLGEEHASTKMVRRNIKVLRGQSMQPCIKCGSVPPGGWYSKSGYCKTCAAEILRENKKQNPIWQRLWFIARKRPPK